ncbi:hypothetical protein [Paenibacillus timonensis]
MLETLGQQYEWIQAARENLFIFLEELGYSPPVDERLGGLFT